MNLADLRRDYTRAGLLESDADADPIRQFRTWLDQAIHAAVPEPYAMTVATASPDGAPAARILLLRGVDERGFAFFTNYDSRKGLELAANPRAALVFFWHELERQVRVEGTVLRLRAEESDAYFRARPRGHCLGAWVSNQSDIIAGREVLEERMAAVEARFPDEVARPPHWGGYRLAPTAVEFWQGRLNRLHDRLRYRRKDNGWVRERLAP